MKMNNKHTLVLLLGFTLFFTSCDLFVADSKVNSGELMPLAVGNYWEYKFNYVGIENDLRYEVTSEVEVPSGDTTYKAYAMNFLPFPTGSQPYYWLGRNGTQGLQVMGGISDTDTLFIDEVQFKFPSEVGETFNSTRVAYSRDRLEFYISDTLSVTLVDDDRVIRTPAGKFTCLVYRYKKVFYEGDIPLDVWDYYAYYTPGIGLVAQIATNEGEPEDVKEEMYLVKFSVKGFSFQQPNQK